MTISKKSFYIYSCLLLLTAVIFLISALSFKTFARGESDKHPTHKHAAGELIIKLKDPARLDQDFLKKHHLKSFNKILEKHKLRDETERSVSEKGLNRLFKAQTVNSDVADSIRTLSQDPLVEYVEPNFILTTLLTPNDPDFTKLWGLNNTGQTFGTQDADIDAPEAWDTATSSAITVGVIDTGIDYNHEDLKQNMWVNQAEATGSAGIDDDANGFVDDVYGYDFANNDSDPFDDHGHGTHVAGTIGAVGNNGIGVAGVNWSSKLAAVKFLNSFGSGTIAGAVSAVTYASNMGFKITNNSWGGGGFSQALFDAISAANNAGALFVAAAGNSFSNTDSFPMYPASYDLPNIIAVAATDHNDSLATFSNYGLNTVDLGAPGVNIYSTVPKGICSLCNTSGYTTLSGTSMATPHVAGAAPLLWSQNPSLTHLGVKDRILNLSDPNAALVGKTVSGGRLNLYNFFDNDTIPPAPISNLAASSTTFRSVALSWSAVGDDGLAGQAYRYDLRYSTTSINEASFNSALKAVGLPKPAPSGQIQNFTVKELSPNTVYYFAIKTFDNVGNASLISNIISVATPNSTVIFSDNFESTASAWIASGSTGEASSSASLWHLSQRKSASPATSWYYGKETTGTYNTGFRNWGMITSPNINLDNISGSQLLFKHLLSTENTSPFTSMFDRATADVSKDNGLTWTTLKAYVATSGLWANEALDLSSFDGMLIQIRFAFDTVDSLYNDFEGWYVDDVKVLGSQINPNQQPVANAGGPYSGLEDQPITLSGAASSDPEGTPLLYKWNFGDGQTVSTSSAQINHTYTTGGTYTATLIVSDGSLDSNPSQATVFAQGVNDKPIANAGSDQIVTTASTVTFDGSLSKDEEGPISSYNWDFGDGTIASGQIVTHTYSIKGIYQVILTVTDTGGLTASDITTVTVNPYSDPSFKGAYFSNQNLSGTPVLVRNDNLIDFNWGKGSPAPEIPKDIFSVRWTKLEYFTAGNYTFTVKQDDGMRIYLDNQLIHDAWFKQSLKNYTFTKFISEGTHSIKVEYFEYRGNAVASVKLTP